MTKKMILNASFYFKTSLEILSKIIFTALIFNWLFWKATDYYSLIAFTAEQFNHENGSCTQKDES